MAEDNAEPILSPSKRNLESPSTFDSAASNGNGFNRPHHRGNDQRKGRIEQLGRGRSGGQGRNSGHKNDRRRRQKKDEVGRAEYTRNLGNTRKRNERSQPLKRRKVDGEGEGEDAVPSPFTAEEIEGEVRKPKRKVAVLIGYAGSGYKGMQINSQQKTIEGDLFAAFVAAGAISKANADDPKKSSLVRCARTDKGVHAAGNIISLKLIIEDPDIVKKINEALPPQIRVWGFERTNGSFSCYQTCDSRWYEYLIPTYSFLPPHPQSFLGKKLRESIEREGQYESYCQRQKDVASFWNDAENTYVNPILERLDSEMRTIVMETIHIPEEDWNSGRNGNGNSEGNSNVATNGPSFTRESLSSEDTQDLAQLAENLSTIPVVVGTATDTAGQPGVAQETSKSILSPFEVALKEVKAAYKRAKKAYRISPERRQMVQEALSEFVGTRNFHNYTIHKAFNDPSAKRVIRSFDVGPDPIVINDTEWLSLRVHGQSFMMHQIRKMVTMAALVVRCGCPATHIKQSYGPDNMSIPKAPGLGLLLERPVFSTYNERAMGDYGREKIDFSKYEKEIEQFKQREIYERIFRTEENEGIFYTFFNQIDQFRSEYFLWVTETDTPAARQSLTKGGAATWGRREREIEISSGDESAPDGEEG